MTDNPIEVQEARRSYDELRDDYMHALREKSPKTANAIAAEGDAAFDRLRTAILKHDPVVTGLVAAARALWDSEEARVTLYASRSTNGLINDLAEALEAYRTAVSEEHGG